MFKEDEAYSDLNVSMMLKKVEKKIVRTDILKNKSRIDGRSLSDVRKIDCQVVFCQERMVQLYLLEENTSISCFNIRNFRRRTKSRKS